MREFVLTLICGFLLGLCCGWYIAWHESGRFYLKDVERLRAWNERLVETIVNDMKSGRGK